MATTSEEHEEDGVEEERGDRGREGRHGGAEGGESLLGEVRGGVGAEDKKRRSVEARGGVAMALKRETTLGVVLRRRRVLVADAIWRFANDGVRGGRTRRQWRQTASSARLVSPSPDHTAFLLSAEGDGASSTESSARGLDFKDTASPPDPCPRHAVLDPNRFSKADTTDNPLLPAACRLATTGFPLGRAEAMPMPASPRLAATD